MNIAITPDLIIDLLDHHGPRDKTGIILTEDGWEVGAWTDLQPSGLVALTKEDAAAYLGADTPEEAHPDVVEALAAEYGGYQVVDENGELTTPPADADPQVVTARWQGSLFDENSGDETYGPGEAWYFDLNTAVKLVQEKHASLWRTAGGRYVRRHFSPGAFHLHRWTWVEMDHSQVAEWAYAAPDAIADDVPLPPVIAAARAARAIVDAMEPPAIPWVEVGGIRDYHADKVVSEAREIVHSAAAISDLLRRTVASQLRGHRARAARVVERAFGRQEDAAQWLGMGRGTFAKLVTAPDA